MKSAACCSAWNRCATAGLRQRPRALPRPRAGRRPPGGRSAGPGPRRIPGQRMGRDPHAAQWRDRLYRTCCGKSPLKAARHGLRYAVSKAPASCCTAIVNDILDFSRIDAGGLQLEEEDFSIGKSSTTCQPAAHQGAGKKMVLSTRWPRAMPHSLQGDALRLSQVLINLVGNAIQVLDQVASPCIDCLELARGRRCCNSASAGHRYRHVGGTAGATLPGLYPGRHLDNPQVRRHRPRPGHHQTPDRENGRHHRRQTAHREAGSTFTFSFRSPVVIGRDAALTNCRFLVRTTTNSPAACLARLLQKHGCTAETERFGQRRL